MKIGSCTQPNSIADSLPLCLSPRTLSSIYSKLGAQNPRQVSTRPAPAENTFGHVCGARSKTFLRLTFLLFFVLRVHVCVCLYSELHQITYNISGPRVRAGLRNCCCSHLPFHCFYSASCIAHCHTHRSIGDLGRHAPAGCWFWELAVLLWQS